MTTSELLSGGHEVTESLASVIGQLRARADRSGAEHGSKLLGATDAFLDVLAEHIAEGEDLVFPTLGGGSPDSRPHLESLKSDHVTLHSAARALAVRILEGGGDEVIDVARVLLVRLLQHVRSEEDVTLRGVELLGGRVQMRLARGVSMRRARTDRRRRGV